MNIRVERNIFQERLNLINDGNIDDVIAFAKSYNIFQENGTNAYKFFCQQIKDRLDKEGLSYDVVQPDQE